MEMWQIIITIIGSVVASGGFWSYLQHRYDKNSAEKRMLVGLAHNEIHKLGMEYIEKGCITKDEYENLYDYLYLPYKDLDGNGSAERIMEEVKKLPICSKQN